MRRNRATHDRRYPSEVVYHPLPKQRALLDSTASVVAFIGGYGSGKSYAGALKAIQLATLNAGLEGMIVAPTFKMLTRVTLSTFISLAKQFIVEHHKQEQRIDLCNGSRIWYASCDSPGSLEGSNLAWWTLDEGRLVAAEAYNILLGRLRVKAATRLQGVVTSTPSFRGWLRKEFDGRIPGREVIRSSSRENTYLADGYVDNLLSSYSSTLARCFIDGEFVAIEDGLVYPEFTRDRNVIEYRPHPDWPVIGGVDFGYRYPAVVYGQIAPSTSIIDGRVVTGGSLIIFDEDVVDGISSEGLGARIARRFPATDKPRLDWLACDPAGATMSSSASEYGGIIDVTAMRSGLALEGCGHVQTKYVSGKASARVRAIHTGIEKVRGKLHNAKGETTLFFARSLLDTRSDRSVLKAIESFIYREGTQIPLRGKPANQVDHVMDALRYLVRHIDIRGASVR